MQQSNSYHLKTQTPRKHRHTSITASELLSKLTQLNKDTKPVNGYIENQKAAFGAKKPKQISKSSGIGSSSNREVVSQDSDMLATNEDINSTAKKSKHVTHISQIWNQKNRTDSNFPTPRKPEVSEFIQNASAFLKEKELESKLDKLSYQVSQLKQKSEILEIQNKMLFDNLQTYQQDRNSSKERNTLISKLDKMIKMQQKQEENLNYFKDLFRKAQKGPNEDELRRVKTQLNFPKLRPSGFSAYLGLKI